MKKTILLLFALCCITLNAKAQTPSPSMAFESAQVDYGKIKEGSNPYRIIKFKNVGNAALVIMAARSNCGCLVPYSFKSVIDPGQEGEIKLRYDTKRIGAFTKYVTIITNEKQDTRTIKVMGEVLRTNDELKDF